MESKEELIHQLNELRNRISDTKVEIKKLNMNIVYFKRKQSKTDDEYQQLKQLTRQLSDKITQLAEDKYNLNKLDKKYNLFYNEHNIKNINEHGISHMFLSYPTPKLIMKKMGFELDEKKTYGENCQDFLNQVSNEDRMKELFNLMRDGINNK